MKSALAAFLSLTAGVVLGYFAYSFLGVPSGRDFWPVLGIAAFPMFFCGLVFGMIWLTSLRSAAVGVVAYALLVAGVVVYFVGGLAIFSVFGYWFAVVFLATLLPWFVGALLGRYAFRPKAA